MTQINGREVQNKRDARLMAYSLMAGAAATAGLTQHAGAAIEYFDIDDISIGQFSSQTLYIDGDQYTDILFKNYVFAGGNYQGVYIQYNPGKLMGTKTGSLIYATALEAGDEISSTTISTYVVGSMSYGVNNPNGEFDNVTDAYVGFSFPIGADLHYAWVRVDVNNAAGTFVIKDFAFENIPNTGILAGAISSALAGDLNSDGFVGLDDLDIILNNWNQTIPPGDDRADVSGAGGEPDGFVGLDDLDVVLNNWNAGTPPTAAVPEPGALSLLAAGSCGVTMWRRRR